MEIYIKKSKSGMHLVV